MRPPVTAERGDGQAFSGVSLPPPHTHPCSILQIQRQEVRMNYRRKSTNLGLINGFQLSCSREFTFPG